MKKLIFMILMISLILLPINVYALTGSISAKCTPSRVYPGETVTCLVSGTSDEFVTSISAAFSVDNGATVTSFQTSNDWEGNDINNNKIDVYTSNDVSGNFNIGTLTLKVNDSATAGNIALNFSNVEFDDVNSSSVNISNSSTSFAVVTERVPGENGLKSLTCTFGGILSPGLSDNNRGYSIILSTPATDSFGISASPKIESDKITYINADTGESLNPSSISFKTSGGKDSMLIRVNVGGNDNLVQYLITVTKPVSEKGILETLVVGGKNVSLTSNKFDYEVTLDDVSSYQIQATVADSSKFKIDSSNLSRSLAGENSYEITVEPIDDTLGYESTTYIVNVSKKAAVPTQAPSSERSIVNPRTGEFGLVCMASILIISLITSIYLYKRNMKEFNN